MSLLMSGVIIGTAVDQVHLVTGIQSAYEDYIAHVMIYVRQVICLGILSRMTL